MTPLQRYFQNRGIAQTVVAPGMLTAACFSDPASEHLATRKACGLFDFSFMACVEISGPHSLQFLHRLQTRDLARLARGRIAYTLLLREDGSVLNDATVWCFDVNHYALFVGRRGDVQHLRQVAAGFDVTLTERSDAHAVIALQGPRSHAVLERCLDKAVAELTQAVTPFELGLSRLVNTYLYDFIGKTSLPLHRWQRSSRRLVGLIPAWCNSELTVADIAPLMQCGSGVRVTSTCCSPLFNRVIALGFVASEDACPGTRVRLSPHITARVARLPFYDAGKALPRLGPTMTDRFAPPNVPPP